MNLKFAKRSGAERILGAFDFFLWFCHSTLPPRYRPRLTKKSLTKEIKVSLERTSGREKMNLGTQAL